MARVSGSSHQSTGILISIISSNSFRYHPPYHAHAPLLQSLTIYVSQHPYKPMPGLIRNHVALSCRNHTLNPRLLTVSSYHNLPSLPSTLPACLPPSGRASACSSRGRRGPTGCPAWSRRARIGARVARVARHLVSARMTMTARHARMLRARERCACLQYASIV